MFTAGKEFFPCFSAGSTTISFLPELVVYRGTECTCGVGGRIPPERHKLACPWRKISDAERGAKKRKR